MKQHLDDITVAAIQLKPTEIKNLSTSVSIFKKGKQLAHWSMFNYLHLITLRNFLGIFPTTCMNTSNLPSIYQVFLHLKCSYPPCPETKISGIRFKACSTCLDNELVGHACRYCSTVCQGKTIKPWTSLIKSGCSM